MARVGIEASSDFAIDVGVQLVSSGFDLNEVKWGDAVFNAGLGILSVRVAGHAGKRMGKGAKGGIIHHSKPLFKRAKENIVAVHNKVAVPFNKGVKKVGKNTFEFLNNIAKNITPHNRLELCTDGINVNEFKGSNPFDKFDIGVFKGKILRLVKGSDGGSRGSFKGTGKFNWNSIKATQEVIEGTNVPRSFVVKDLMVNGKEVWVGGNATKHMGEFINSANKSGGGLLSENEIMESFMNAAKLASEQTLKHSDNRLLVSGWEIGINGETGVIYHALMK